MGRLLAVCTETARRLRLFLPVFLAAMAVGTAQAGVLSVAGSPAYDPATRTGMDFGAVASLPGSPVNNNGVAVGCAEKWVRASSHSHQGSRAVRWDAAGTATELPILSIDGYGDAYAKAYAINDAGIAVGYASDADSMLCPVRWNASGTVVTELAGLRDNTGHTMGRAVAINNAGTAVGYTEEVVNGMYAGEFAVRWDTSGTATELAGLGTDNRGLTHSQACAINAAGTTVGFSLKCVDAVSKGARAMRWNALTGAATELDCLEVDGDHMQDCRAVAINAAGTAVGSSRTYDSGNPNSGDERAVRWGPSGTAATELQGLGTFVSGFSVARASAINNAGTAVGASNKFVDGVCLGYYAVRWDASGAITELDHLGLTKEGKVDAQAIAVNDAGTAVGYSARSVDGQYINVAAVWLPNGTVIDLNDLGVSPVSDSGQWWLDTASAITADGWVAGVGGFLPTGAKEGYTRAWVAQVGLGGSWTNVAGGTWGRGPNWSTGTPAMQVGNAAFDLDSAYSVALDRDELTKTIAINAGNVSINGNGHTLATESGLSIASGAILKGTATIVSNIINAGTIAPGNSPGTLDVIGDLLNAGTIEFEVASLSSHDRLNLTGVFSAGGTLVVSLLDGYAPVKGDFFDLMDFASFVNNGYAFDLSHAALSPGLAWDTTAFATTGVISVVGVPEPSSIILLGVGAAILLAFTRRRPTA